jgi:hypothetical protein
MRLRRIDQMIVYEIETTVRIEISVSAATHEEAKKLAEAKWEFTEDQLYEDGLIKAEGIDVILQGKPTRRWFDEDAEETDDEMLDRKLNERLAEQYEEEEGLTL